MTRLMPTGIKIGVSITPCGVLKVPLLALDLLEVFNNLKLKCSKINLHIKLRT